MTAVELKLSSPAGTGKPAGAVLGSSAMSTMTSAGKVGASGLAQLYVVAHRGGRGRRAGDADEAGGRQRSGDTAYGDARREMGKLHKNMPF